MAKQGSQAIEVQEIVHEKPPSKTWGREKYVDVDTTIQNEEMGEWFGMNLGKASRREVNALRAAYYGPKNHKRNGFAVKTRTVRRDGQTWLYMIKIPPDDA